MTDDYYRFDEKAHILKGENTGQGLSPGRPGEVQVARVDLERRKIDFALVDVLERAAAGAGPDGRRGPRVPAGRPPAGRARGRGAPRPAAAGAPPAAGGRRGAEGRTRA